MKIFIDKLKTASTRLLFTAFVISLLVATPRTQTTAQQSPEDRIALYQALLDLTNPWTVMCVAAHPDDEDGTSLIVMRRKYGAHTVSLFTTFGEGGQNAIGPELYEELGAIRARETMAASEIQGSEPHFLGLNDFGFSKSAEETFRFWGRDEALRRMVLQIRKLRPDVIITNHDTGGGHGHHQVTGRAVLEAFDAAADPKRFPQQLKDGVTSWQVQRLFVRSRGSAADASIVTIDPNERDPVRNTMFAEQALAALQKHATQGPWPRTIAERLRNSPDGRLPLIRYRLVREAKGADALAKDSHNFVDGMRLPDKIAKQLIPPKVAERPLLEFVNKPPLVLDALLSAWRSNSFAWPSSHETDPRISAMMDRLKTAIAETAGVRLSLTKSQRVLVPGTTTIFAISISNRGNAEVRIPTAVLFGPDFHRKPDEEEDVFAKKGPGIVAPHSLSTVSIERNTPRGSPINLPTAAHLYDGRLFGERFRFAVSLRIQGATIMLIEETTGDVAPPVQIERIVPSPLVLTPQNYLISFSIRAVNHQSKTFNGTLSAANQRISIEVPAEATRDVTLTIPHAQRPRTSEVEFVLHGSASDSATIPVTFANAVVARDLKVAYIRGFDFSLQNALNALGVESTELSVDEVKTTDLSKFTSIIVDNRVYESQPELIATNQKLLDYANAGGNLIIFYHRIDEFNPNPQRNRPQLSPYKLILGNERITDENAPISFLEPDHPLMNSPNKLNQDDFKGWIQERGLYYPREWDPQFHALLQSNDPGEGPLKGGLLVADYGNGHYIYTSMVWYRQLRAGVPGAYRMLANMISYGRN